MEEAEPPEMEEVRDPAAAALPEVVRFVEVLLDWNVASAVCAFDFPCRRFVSAPNENLLILSSMRSIQVDQRRGGRRREKEEGGGKREGGETR